MYLIDNWIKISKNYINNNLEKRYALFNYLVNLLEYDFNYYSRINRKLTVRSPVNEFDNILFKRKGICSSISQLYHILLMFSGFKSICVCCNDNKKIHEVVYCIDTNSFDDLTKAIMSKENKNDYFNYSMKTANELGQGIESLFSNVYWQPISNDWIKYIIDNSKFSSLLKNYLLQSQFTI